MTFLLSNKIALITGANRGIGKEIVNSFIAHGATKVYLAVRDIESTKDLKEKYGSKVVTVFLNLTIPESIIALAEQTEDVNIVVNSAGVLTLTSPLDANLETAFKKELDVNVFGFMRMAQAFTPIIEKNGGGAFVQLNSIASIIGGKTFSTYSASKAASYSFTQSLKECLEPKNIQVVSVHPGPIDTDMGAEAGMAAIAEPATVVSESIIIALKNGDFHVFPDTMAKEFGNAYMPYAKKIIENE